jgi:fatty acid desaturase
MQEEMSVHMQKFQIVEPSRSSALEIQGNPPILQDVKTSQSPISVNEYAELKRLVKLKGLLNQQPIYYTYKILLTIGLLTVSVIFLLVVNNFGLQILNAVYMAFVFGQIGFLGHDMGHRQIFRTSKMTEIGSSIVGNLLLGWSWSWWVDKHNRHHGHPNSLDSDPDIAIPLLAFTEAEARSRQGFPRFMVKHQAYLFLPLELLGWLAFLIFSIRHLLEKKAKHPLAEMLLMGLHYVLYFGLLLSRLTIWQTIVFFIVQRALFGLYLGSVAAPNHKGMLVLDKDSQMDFLRQQVLTSRNIKGHLLTDMWYGGLNYQIEHHLFPIIPRNRLREVQQTVKVYCQEHSIPYHETGVLQSYREILGYLNEVSASLRCDNRENIKVAQETS